MWAHPRDMERRLFAGLGDTTFSLRTETVKNWVDTLSELHEEHTQLLQNSCAKDRIQTHHQDSHDLSSQDRRPSRAHSLSKKALDCSLHERKKALLTRSEPPSQVPEHPIRPFLIPQDGPKRLYNRLQYISVMADATDYHHFRPEALSFASSSTYLNAHDKGQRVLVYGGVTNAGQRINSELYEFSLLTAKWNRIEGKEFVPLGHMGHTMVVVEALNKLVVIGGIGPGEYDNFLLGSCNIPSEDPLRATRARLLLPDPCPHSSVFLNASSRKSRKLVGALGHRGNKFIPFFFEMNLTNQRWKAVHLAQPLPIAFHTAVTFGGEIFIFGGLTEDFFVSGQLIAIRATDYRIRLIKVSPGLNSDLQSMEDESVGVAPGPRYLHSAVRYKSLMIIHGGYDKNNRCCGDTWAFDFVTERWEELRTGKAPARAGHTACTVGPFMVVVGGFDALSFGQDVSPTTNVLSLRLIPTTEGDYEWVDRLRASPRLPPLVFTTSASCGDNYSFVVYSGLTEASKNLKKEKPSTLTQEALSHQQTSESSLYTSSTRSTCSSGRKQKGGEARSRLSSVNNHTFFQRYLTLDDCLILTFPVQSSRLTQVDMRDQRRINELGVEDDTDKLYETFEKFVLRQHNFLKKKHNNVKSSIDKIMLREKEEMEPNLYLRSEDIELLLERSNECYDAFSSYNVDFIPPHVPDREVRIHIIEECISLSRQMRDVVKSMKGSASGVATSKQRNRSSSAGRKFEDYSTAKPLRRVVIKQILDQIKDHLLRMTELNKALRRVEWEDKNILIEAVGKMHDKVHTFCSEINRIVNQFVTRRVECLTRSSQRHNKSTERTPQKRDKTGSRDQFRNTQDNDRTKRPTKRSASHGFASHVASHSKIARAVSSESRQAAQDSIARSGGRYYANAQNVSIPIHHKALQSLEQQTNVIIKTAMNLEEYCKLKLEQSHGACQSSTTPQILKEFSSVPDPSCTDTAKALVSKKEARAHGFSSSSSSSSSVTDVDTAGVNNEPVQLPLPVSLKVESSEVAGGSVLSSESPHFPTSFRLEMIDLAAFVRSAASSFLEALKNLPQSEPLIKKQNIVITSSGLVPDTVVTQTRFEQGLTSTTQVNISDASSNMSHSDSLTHRGGDGRDGMKFPDQEPDSASASSAKRAVSSLKPNSATHVPSGGLVNEQSLKCDTPTDSSLTGNQPKETFKVTRKRIPPGTVLAPPPRMLSLSKSAPLFEAKAKLERMESRVSSLFGKEEGAVKGLVTAEKTKLLSLYKHLEHQLTFLTQKITSSFLSIAGAKPKSLLRNTLTNGTPPKSVKREYSSRLRSSACLCSEKKLHKSFSSRTATRQSVSRPRKTTSRIPNELVGSEKTARNVKDEDKYTEETLSHFGVPAGPVIPSEVTPRLTHIVLDPLPIEQSIQDGDLHVPSTGAKTGAVSQVVRALPLVNVELLCAREKSNSPPTIVGNNDTVVVEACGDVPYQERENISPIEEGPSRSDNVCKEGHSFSWNDNTYTTSLALVSPQDTGFLRGTSQRFLPLSDASMVCPLSMTEDSQVLVSVASGPAFSFLDNKPTATNHIVSSINERKDLSDNSLIGTLPRSTAKYADEPTVSLTGGPFAVNPQYYWEYLTNTEENIKVDRPDQSFFWKDTDDDYFYFSQPEKQRGRSDSVFDMVSTRTRSAEAKRKGEFGEQLPISASGPVATVLFSDRVNAHNLDFAYSPIIYQ